MADRAALEMRCTGNRTQGSNPCLSARRGVNQVITRFTPLFYACKVRSLSALLDHPIILVVLGQFTCISSNKYAFRQNRKIQAVFC